MGLELRPSRILKPREGGSITPLQESDIYKTWTWESKEETKITIRKNFSPTEGR